MGLFSIFKGTDEAAKGADEAAKLSDGFISNDDAVINFGEEGVGGVNPSFTGDSYGKRVFADFTGRVADGSTPSAVVDAGTSNIADATKYAAGGTVAVGGLWAGSSIYDDYSSLKTAESKEATYSEYKEALEKIRDDPNLSPDQKEEAIARLREAYLKAIENAENEGAKGGLADSVTGFLSDASEYQKLLVALTLIIAVYVAQEAM